MKNPTQTSKGMSRYHLPLLQLISVVSITYLLYYLWWRATSTLNPHAPIFSWVLLLAEAFGVVSYILFAWMTQDISLTRAYKPPRPGLTVDIFVPTYNESLDILEATLIGCRKIKYPHKTYILDDGKREEVRQLAELLGCHYLTRPTNEHAKAGNINHALTRTEGEFLVVLDADMVPQPNFLNRTLGYFEDENLAFIQMPQEFYNHDSIQHDKKANYWHEQALFFRVIQPGKNYSNSAFWCGSPSIVRRKALEQVGGVATETITEDIHTSVRLHSCGWSSYFLNEALAYGIAPQTVKSFLLQRLRWAQGTMQLYRSSDSPLWVRGVTIRQRFSYLSSFLAYFESFQKFILILTPVFIIMFNVFPMRVDILEFLLRWTPYFVLNILANSMGGRHYFRYFQTEKYNILKMVIFIQSTLTLVSRKNLKFKVTPKSVDSSVYKDERKTLRFYMVILGAITGAILYGFWKTVAWQGTTLGMQAFLIALFWAAYNAMLIFVGIYEILGKHHERKQYRFEVDLEGDVRRAGYPMSVARARIDNLSITGASFVLDGKFLAESNELLLRFYTSSRKFIMLPIAKVHRQYKDSKGQVHVGVSFSNKMDLYRERLFEYLFVELPGQQPVEPRTIRGVSAVFQELLNQRSRAMNYSKLIEETMP